jgi:pimeloyl-ACP methyl ester carboxylesterase
MNSEIRNSLGEKLDYSFLSGNAHSKTIIVIGHGVTGNKDRPLVIGLAEALAADGADVLRFSFSGNGDSEGDFRNSTISKEVSDLGSVLDAVSGNYERIIYAGHSMGGAVGVLRTSSDDRISALISLAGMVYTKIFAEVEFGDETPDSGFMWEDEDCPLSSTYINDMNAIDNVLDKASQITVPWLLVHGTEDDVVPVQESHDIFAKASSSTELEILDGCGHVFSEKGSLAAMTTTVAAWVRAL